MIALRSDTSTRTVVFHVTGEDPIIGYTVKDPAKRNAGLLSPATITLEFANDNLMTVSVHGPRITARGLVHATRWISWNWPGRRVAGRVSFADTEVPAFVVAALESLGYDRQGLRK